jgi:subtilisin family serine protease
VAAAGNQGKVGSSTITRHPWVIPVVSCDGQGLPTSESNLGDSIGRRGLRAPGQNITSLGTNGKSLTFSGTSAAAPFVTGTIALLWSEFPDARAAEVKLAITRCGRKPRNTLVPPLLDAWTSYQVLASTRNKRGMSWTIKKQLRIKALALGTVPGETGRVLPQGLHIQNNGDGTATITYCEAGTCYSWTHQISNRKL